MFRRPAIKSPTSGSVLYCFRGITLARAALLAYISLRYASA